MWTIGSWKTAVTGRINNLIPPPTPEGPEDFQYPVWVHYGRKTIFFRLRILGWKRRFPTSTKVMSLGPQSLGFLWGEPYRQGPWVCWLGGTAVGFSTWQHRMFH